MADDSMGGTVVVIFFCMIALVLGGVAGSFHIGEEISQTLIPSSITNPPDVIKPINEGNFTSENITLTYPKKQVTYTRNYTTTNTTNTTDTTDDTNNNEHSSDNKHPQNNDSS
ncbi:MAG: hypothetical protein E7Z84_03050 [Methanosphaera stadtmanae]|jgi:hypothetical protein|nr:hypothetical protein [Methanosphaera stadtmanae]